jgi:hypothetical protein
MRFVAAKLGWFAAVLLALALVAPAGQAAPARQRDDRLDQPLLAANMCGAGAPGEVHFTLAATGDTFPHENIQAAGEAFGYDYLFDQVRPFLQAADLAYTNFDGAMLEGSPHTGYPAFNYSPRLATALKNAGIGLVSTANNHIMDRGPEGLDATLGVLEQNGIRQHGTVASAAAGEPRPAFLPITLSRDGASVRVAFLSFSWGTNGIPDPYSQVNLLWESNEYGQQGGTRQAVLDAIAEARSASDLVVVAAHWGYEYQFYPDASQVEGARRMAEAGADVILGAQSHTLQPVDIIDTNGRKTLVVYSLANFLASQGAFQNPYYSATSVVFYVGFARGADGQVRLTGYRYLPTVHVDGDTRPAPIPPQGYEDTIAHVRLEMRDPGGLRQLSHDPAALGGRVLVCPALELPGGQVLAGDFAQFYASLGGTVPRLPDEALAVLGAPLGPPAPGLAGDCTPAVVLATERQRLELHPALDWPFRVSGTQIGASVYRRRYGDPAPQRRTDVAGGAIADPRFKAFFERYGGLPVFGYPIDGLLTEQDAATGQPNGVQYFERARFELVPGAPADAPLEQQVRLGALMREYPGAEAECPSMVSPAPTTATLLAAPTAGPAAQTGGSPPAPLADRTSLVSASTATRPAWLWPAIGLNVLLLVAVAGWGWRIRSDMQRRRRLAARKRRRAVAQAAPTPRDDDDLLRSLLEL